MYSKGVISTSGSYSEKILLLVGLATSLFAPTQIYLILSYRTEAKAFINPKV